MNRAPNPLSARVHHRRVAAYLAGLCAAATLAVAISPAYADSSPTPDPAPVVQSAAPSDTPPATPADPPPTPPATPADPPPTPPADPAVSVSPAPELPTATEPAPGSPPADGQPVPSNSPSSTAKPSVTPSHPSGTPTAPTSDKAPPVNPNSDGTVPEATANADAVYENWQKAESLRVVLADLDVALTLAMQATTQARLELQYAVRNADQADKDAADAQLVLEAVAREMYMRGGDPNLMEVMLSASQSTSLADILNVADYLRSVSDDRVNAALAAYAEADVAHAALADAVEDVARLSEKEDALRKKRDKVASELKAVNAAYENAIIAEVPPQMKVGTDGCPKEVPENTLRDGAETVGAQALCRHAVKQAATPQAALAIKWAFTRLGAAYACGGVGRMLPWRMDCSSYVSRAYFEGAHMPVAGFDWAPSTRNMVPWDGIDLDPHYLEVAPGAIRPGDLVLYDTGGAAYRHVVMYLGEVDGVAYMAHTNACGDVAHVSQFWGFDGSHAVFLVARRVLPAGTDPKTVTAQHPEGKQRVTR